MAPLCVLRVGVCACILTILKWKTSFLKKERMSLSLLKKGQKKWLLFKQQTLEKLKCRRSPWVLLQFCQNLNPLAHFGQIFERLLRFEIFEHFTSDLSKYTVKFYYEISISKNGKGKTWPGHTFFKFKLWTWSWFFRQRTLVYNGRARQDTKWVLLVTHVTHTWYYISSGCYTQPSNSHLHTIKRLS